MSTASPNRSFVPDRPVVRDPGDGLPSVQRRSQRRRRLLRTAVGAGVALVVVLLFVTSGGGSGGGAKATPMAVRATLASTSKVASVTSDGPAATLPWPTTGQAAVAVPDLGYLAQSGTEKAVPVASLTKIMTAYLILRDHPLAAGASGPAIPITTADADNFGMDTVTDQASVELQAGEVLTEYQLLEGLLVHSANDFAFVLANWDAGSVDAFVAKMNATAVALGMHDSHFADASGLSTGSTSTAADLLRLATVAMSEPAFAAIVQMPSVTLPVAGTVESYTPLVGTTPGVVGVKSGFTSAAGGGDVLAYQATVGGMQFLTLAAVTSQEGPTVLESAGRQALALAQAAASHLQPYPVTAARRPVGTVTATGHVVAVRTASAATLLAMPGDVVHQQVSLHRPRAHAPAGTVVGTATFRVGSQVATVPVTTAARLP